MLKNYPEILERIKKNETIHDNECSGADIFRAVRDKALNSFRFQGVLWEISLFVNPRIIIADIITADDEKMPLWYNLTDVLKDMIAHTLKHEPIVLALDGIYYQVHIDVLESES